MSYVIDKSKIAIVLLAYADFESLEIALAAYSKFLPKDIPFYILQNGRGTYDCERTYRVALRYQNLYPDSIKVVDWITPKAPYYSIQELLNSDEMKQYDYICKVDDDVFPLTDGWLDKLINCYQESKNKYGDNLGYVTSLVNNNPWGFNEVLDILNLKEEYFEKIAMPHIAGGVGFEPAKLIPKNIIYTGGCGTVWKNPYISRWLHKQTSLKPEFYVDKTRNSGFKEVDNSKRYSINVMFFQKEFWKVISNGRSDDEAMISNYCKKNNKRIIADLSNPFVHLCFFTQREENRDLLPQFREVYENFLNLPYPISMCPNKEYENENRLRYIEKQLMSPHPPQKTLYKRILEFILSVKDDKNRKHKIFTVLGIRIKIRK